MNEIGRVVAIINENHLLVTSSQVLNEDEVLIVGGEIPLTSEESKKQAGVAALFFPKGRLHVVALQKDGLYLTDPAPV